MAIKHKAAIVGLGRIGNGYDADTDAHGDAPPRSHVAAVLRNPDLELIAVCDSDPLLIGSFQRTRRLPVKAYTSVQAMLAAGHYDLITIATPAGTHESIALKCLETAPALRALFCEKPLGTNAESADRITVAARKAGVALAVNYHRRWDARISQLKHEIAGSGGARYASFQFVKGWSNYGAHAIDLLRHLFGRVVSVQSFAPTARLRFAEGLDADLTLLDALDYEMFDLEVVCKTKRLRAVFGGQQILQAQPQSGRFFPGYTVLGEETRLVRDAPVHGLTHAYAELAGYISRGAFPETSTGENAVTTHRIIEAIEKSATSGALVHL